MDIIRATREQIEEHLDVKVKRCPCCDSSDLDVGVQSAQTFGIMCRDCGIEMSKLIPFYFDEDIMKMDYREFTLRRAIHDWNRRPE